MSLNYADKEKLKEDKIASSHSNNVAKVKQIDRIASRFAFWTQKLINQEVNINHYNK